MKVWRSPTKKLLKAQKRFTHDDIKGDEDTIVVKSKTGFDRNGSRILDKRFPRFSKDEKRSQQSTTQCLKITQKVSLFAYFKTLQIEILDVQNYHFWRQNSNIKKWYSNETFMMVFKHYAQFKTNFPKPIFPKHICLLLTIVAFWWGSFLRYVGS